MDLWHLDTHQAYMQRNAARCGVDLANLVRWRRSATEVRSAMSRFRLAKVRHADEIAAAAILFREYADWLGIDLSFQGFEAELESLPGKYAPPIGELMLAYSPAGEALGCVAVRPLQGAAVCEMKRLYVRPAARGLGIGAALVAAIIRSAEELGYTQMKLDTLPSMPEAFALYKRCGFLEIPAYYHNPVPGTVYLGKQLSPVAPASQAR
jgi:ribosomal protein S18 acetylase RimI-like enzyme